MKKELNLITNFNESVNNIIINKNNEKKSKYNKKNFLTIIIIIIFIIGLNLIFIFNKNKLK